MREIKMINILGKLQIILVYSNQEGMFSVENEIPKEKLAKLGIAFNRTEITVNKKAQINWAFLLFKKQLLFHQHEFLSFKCILIVKFC